MAKGKLKPKRPSRKFDITECLQVKTQLERAKCGLAVAAFILPKIKGKPKECHREVAEAGLSTSINSLEQVTILADELAPGAKKVKAAASRARNILKGGALTKDMMEKANKVVVKAQEIVGKVTEEAEAMCRRRR